MSRRSHQQRNNRRNPEFRLSKKGIAFVTAPVALGVAIFLGMRYETDEPAVDTARLCTPQEEVSNPQIGIDQVGDWVGELAFMANTTVAHEKPELNETRRIIDNLIDRNRGLSDAPLGVSKPQNPEAFVCMTTDGDEYRLIGQGLILQSLVEDMRSATATSE